VELTQQGALTKASVSGFVPPQVVSDPLVASAPPTSKSHPPSPLHGQIAITLPDRGHLRVGNSVSLEGLRRVR
jgi:hypothetical protein